jgi:hypothetical protein
MIAWKITFICLSFLFLIAIRLGNRFISLLLSIFAGLFMAFRPLDVGSDTRNYMVIFEIISLATWEELFLLPYEWGYLACIKIVSFFVQDFRYFLVVFWFFLYYKASYAANKVFTLFLFSPTLLIGVNGFRQFCAMFLFILLYENKIGLKRLLTVSFHLSSIVLFLVKNSSKSIVITLLMLNVGSFILIDYRYNFSIMAILSGLSILLVARLIKRKLGVIDLSVALSMFYLLSGPKIFLRLAVYVWMMFFISFAKNSTEKEVYFASLFIFILTVCPILFLTNL